MDTLNVNVLVAAKEEYTKQLIYILSPEIYVILNNVYIESQKMKKKRSISLRNYQILLKRIPLWNTIIIEKHTKDIKSKIPYLLDLITAIFVSHVKILACVRLKSNSKSINVKVPNLDSFLHKIIITNAEKVYYNPDVILNKKEICVQLISETIEETILNQIPIDKILTEYLSGVFDEDTYKNDQIQYETHGEAHGEAHGQEHDENDDVSEDEYISDDEELEGDIVNESKNIIPSRQLPQLHIPDVEVPTTDIKQRVLFPDAVGKNIKSNVVNEGDNESDNESDDETIIEYNDDDDDDDDDGV